MLWLQRKGSFDIMVCRGKGIPDENRALSIILIDEYSLPDSPPIQIKDLLHLKPIRAMACHYLEVIPRFHLSPRVTLVFTSAIFTWCNGLHLGLPLTAYNETKFMVIPYEIRKVNGKSLHYQPHVPGPPFTRPTSSAVTHPP